jgi:hypothetical protein
VARFDEILLVTPSARGTPLQRERLIHGRRQLIIIGAQPDEVTGFAHDGVRTATLGLEPVERAPLDSSRRS